MKRQAIFMALLALAFQAQAVPVSVNEAARAARAWVSRGGTLGARLGDVVSRATTQTLPSGAKVHAVQMRGGGAVFLSADTDFMPVIAFTSADADYSQIDSKSPLWALLCRDAVARGTTVKAAAKASASGASAATASGSAAARQWAALLAEGAALDDPTVRQPARAHVSSPGDLRAGPFVQTAWNQGAVRGKDCYNRFTPILSDGTRAVCGCVATAMAQVMRYHEYPTAACAPVTRRCFIEAATRGKTAGVTNLTTQAGVYDWANMPLKPNAASADLTDAQCDAIGKLTSDAGISVYMAYDLAAKGGSGAFLFNVAKALMEVFGYANAAYYTADEVSANVGILRRAMLSNFDAGYPVLMGVSGEGGHAIIGDGYGYNDGAVYVHLNMGWSGACDLWYNLPDIDSSYGHYTVFSDLVFNVFPTEAARNATLSGRVTDVAANAVAGAFVQIRAATGGAEVAHMTTDTNGMWGVRLPAGTYEIAVTAPDFPVETRTVTVAATRATTKSLAGWIVNGSWSETYTNVPQVSTVGNAWGEDVQLVAPRARIVQGAVTNVYATLDQAITGARACAAQPDVSGVTIELLDAIDLNARAVIDFPCVLTAGGADAATRPIRRIGDADLGVQGTLTLSNVTFAAKNAMAVRVNPGAQLVVASGVDFGVPSSMVAVSVADADGFVLAGELSHGFSLSNAAASSVGAVFGTAICDFLTASNSAARIANAYDTHGEMRGVAVEQDGEILLTWDVTPVPFSEAAAYFVDASGATNAAARLESVLEKYRRSYAAGEIGAAGEIVVRDVAGQSLLMRQGISGNLTLRGERAGVRIEHLFESAGFDIGVGASLTVKDLVFDGYVGKSLFEVKGGALILKGGTEIRNVSGTETQSGALTVLSGTATVGSPEGEVVFDGCVNDTANSCGGAIHLAGSDCELILQNQVCITNGHARKNGGGVYVGAGANVRLSGLLTIRDNVRKQQQNKAPVDNLYFESDVRRFVLAGPLEAGSSVGVWCASSLGNAGSAFLTVDAGFRDHAQILRSCAALVSDKNAALTAAPNDDDSAIVWEEDDGSIRPVDPSIAVARVTANGTSAYYGLLEDAFGVLTGDATVEILQDVDFANDVRVTNVVTFVGGEHVVSRRGSARFVVSAGGALTLDGVTVAGGAGPAFEVAAEGALTLSDGACIRDIASGATRVGGAITVNGGALTMLPGSAIRNCRSTGDNYACGGAVAADSQSRLRLLGGEIADCVSNYGGVYIGNESTAEIGGAFTATNNVSETGEPKNLYVAANCRLVLVQPLTGRVGYTPGVTIQSTNAFGSVAADFNGTTAQLADSAHGFTHDVTGDVGLAVTGGNERLLVWSDALQADGTVTVGDERYELVPGGATLTAAVVRAESRLSFVYDGTAKTCVLAGHGFVVTCTPQTQAGDYVATATVKAGFAWADGTTTPQAIAWAIAKAVYDMSGVTFADRTFTYNGQSRSLAISGSLPAGVEVSYDGNGQTDPGIYTVTAHFAGDAVNYEPIPDRTAKLTILAESETPDPPSPSVTTNVPKPIAFQSIARVSETEWSLTVTNRVPWCWYRLLATDDLTRGFVTTGAWERATTEGAWTTNVTTTGGARFWKAEAKEGEVGE